MQNQSHIGICKRWHKQPSACKRWHRKSNRVLTCVTLKIKTFLPIKRCHVSWRRSLKAPLIKVWHMSPIELRRVWLTHPQTPINKSLPKAFLNTKTSRAQVASKKIQKYLEVQKLCRNQASNPSRNSTSKSKNIRSRIIQTIYLDPKVCWNQAQKPLETLTNHKSMKLYRFKPPKYRRTSTTNLQRRRTRRTWRTRNF